jgi:hypothetical protein
MPGMLRAHHVIEWDNSGISKRVAVTPAMPVLGRTYAVEMEIKMHRADYDVWQRGVLKIQDALPYLNADQREFLMSGILPEEWARIFPPPKD